MKVNLIYDMRNGLNDWVDDFSDEERGDAVLTVLKSSRNNKEFEKILEGIENPKREFNRDNVFIRELLVSSQVSEWEMLKLNYNFIG